MNTIYIVTDTWVNDEGFPITPPSIVCAFDTLKNAKGYCDDNRKKAVYTNSTHKLNIVETTLHFSRNKTM